MSECTTLDPPCRWHRTAAIGALEANLWNLWSMLGRPAEARLVDTPELLAIETPIDRIPYNAVLRTRATGGRIDELIDERLESCRRRGVPLVWLVNPTARPTDLRARLDRRNLVHADTLTGMIGDIAEVHRVDATAPPGIELIAGDPTDAGPWIELVTDRYGVRPDHDRYLRDAYAGAGIGGTTLLWLAVRDGRPLSKAFVRLADGVAGVHGVATVDEARGLGLARLCTLRALQDARRRGYTTSVLHATPMAVSLYRRMGFAEVAPFDLHAEPGALHLEPPSGP